MNYLETILKFPPLNFNTRTNLVSEVSKSTSSSGNMPCKVHNNPTLRLWKVKKIISSLKPRAENLPQLTAQNRARTIAQNKAL